VSTEWDLNLFEASWGGLSLNLLSTEDDLSRVIAQHTYPHVDGGNTEDMGSQPRTTAVEIVFFGNGSLSDLNAFMNLVAEGEPNTFIHPITGSYSARVEALSMRATAEDRDWVSVSCTFIEATTEVSIFQLNETGNALAGTQEVENAKTDTDTALSDNDLESDVPADALELAQSWSNPLPSDPPLSSARIDHEINQLLGSIETEIDLLGLAADLGLYPVLVAFQNLAYAVRRAGEVAISRTPKLETYTVLHEQPLLWIAQELYGADQSVDRWNKLIDLNRSLKTPELVPAGTVLTIEAK
jgi:prophage DNA circulation protein